MCAPRMFITLVGACYMLLFWERPNVGFVLGSTIVERALRPHGNCIITPDTR